MKFKLFVPAGLTEQVSSDGRRAWSGRERSDASGDAPLGTDLEVDDGDPIELMWEEGTTVVLLAEQVRLAGTRRSGGSVTLPQLGGSARGGLLAKIVRVVIGGLGSEALTEAGATALARRIEEHKGAPQGFMRIGEFGAVSPGEPVAADKDQEILLFIHGTIARTEDGFRDLLKAPDDWHGLYRHFMGRTFGFDHRTFTVDPLTNAAEILEKLPHGARLRLVTHSRGGLVGDLLAAACAGERNQGLNSDDPEIKGLLQRFSSLAAMAKKRKIKVISTVRIAAPSLGTTLASGRLDLWLNVLLNTLTLVPPLGASPLYAAVKGLLTGVVKARFNTSIMPGIAAMAPGGPFVRWTNALRAEDRLFIAAGDAGSKVLLEKLKTVLADLVFMRENDLVVDTASMVGGVSRISPAPDGYRLWRGGERWTLDHFKYFSIPELRGWLRGGLVDDDDAPMARGGSAARSVASPAARAMEGDDEATRLPCVIVVPDFLGSRLDVPETESAGAGDAAERVWPSVASMARSRALLGAEGALNPVALLPEIYPPSLFEAFPTSMEVRAFPYDWRLTLSESARRLAEEIAKLQGRVVSILAHGAGGLVARGVCVWHPQVWAQMKKDGGRVVLVAPPNRGTWVAARLLAGEHPLVDQLAAADLSGAAESAVDMLWRWPGLLALLPVEPTESTANARLFDHDWWHRPDRREALEQARTERQALDAVLDPDRLVVVVGRGESTPLDLASDGGALELAVSSEGDGWVSWASSALDGVPTIQVDLPHGELLSAPAWRTLWPELARGNAAAGTSRAQMGRPTRVPAPGFKPPALHPTDLGLVKSAFGAQIASQQAPLTVTVVHGDIAFETRTLLVGHPAGRWLRCAEPGLDIVLRGALSTRLRLGAYPQEVGEVAVVPRARRGAEDHPAPIIAVVAGLGPHQALTRSRVAEAVEAAVVEAALPTYDAVFAASGLPDMEARQGISVALPLGIGPRGLSVDDLVSATLEAVILANRRLNEFGLLNIKQVRLVFSFGDHAKDAVRAAVSWSRNPGTVLERSESVVVAPPEVSPQAESTWVPPDQPLQARGVGDFQRIEARRGERSEVQSITFVHSGPGAAASRLDHEILWARATELSQGLTASSRFDRDAVRALRDYVLPSVVAASLDRGPDAQIAVDRVTAAIPWEAFVLAGARAELTGRTALLRQLIDVGEPVAARSVEERRALVVRSPKPAGDQWPALAGVEPEARAVASTLAGAGYEVAETDGPWTEVVAALTRPAQILHLVGHGAWEPQKQEGTGFVTSDGAVLGRAQLRSLRRAPPALVFINACSLGRLDGQRGAFAADLASFLISEVGVAVVIAAGWSIGDDAAVAFARTLYERLVDGAPLRLAVAAARVAAIGASPRDATWAAYQCYGDPEFVLPSTAETRSSLDQDLEALVEAADLVSAGEIADMISQVHGRLLLEDVDAGDGARSTRQRDLVDHYVEAVLRRWERLPPGLRGSEPTARLEQLMAYARWTRKAGGWTRATEPASPPETLGTAEPRVSRPRKGPDTTATLRQALAERLGVTYFPSAVPRGPAAEGILEVERAIKDCFEGVADLKQGVPSGWGDVPNRVRQAIQIDNTGTVRRDLGCWLHVILRAFRDTLADQADARHAFGTSLIEPLDRICSRFWDDPNLNQFGGLHTEGGCSVNARIRRTSDRWCQVVPRLVLPEDLPEGVLTMHLHPTYRVPVRVWPFKAGRILDGGAADTWWANGAYTLGVRIYTGTPKALKYEGPPWSPPANTSPVASLELDLAQCEGADEPFKIG